MSERKKEKIKSNRDNHKNGKRAIVKETERKREKNEES